MLPPADPLAHSPRHLSDPEGWVLYLSHSQPKRLVVFVHGFWGGALKSWQQFPEGGLTRGWWRASACFSSATLPERRTSLVLRTGSVNNCHDSSPTYKEELTSGGTGAQAFDAALEPYSELLLVGHSLGGVVVRRALCEVAH